MGTNLRINADRLWDSLMEMAKIGATEKGGVCRLALTDLDRQARDLFCAVGEGSRLHHQDRQDGQHLRAPSGQGQFAVARR